MRAAIVLAAGRSRRFHGANKLLARWRGRALIDHALAAARAAPVGRVLVVLGHDRRRLAARIGGPRMTTIFARDHRDGLAESLRAGLRALRPNEREVFVFLGDMPMIPAFLPARLARAHVAGRRRGAPARARRAGASGATPPARSRDDRSARRR